MKTTLLTTFILFTGFTFSQSMVTYTYDDAGNRIKRESSSTNMTTNNDNNATVNENLAVSGVELEAHPNPTSKNTEVTVIIDFETIAPEDKTAIETGVSMQLADVTGKVLKTEKGNAMQQSFNLEGMSSGVYFVKVFTENGKLVGERKILRE